MVKVEPLYTWKHTELSRGEAPADAPAEAQAIVKAETIVVTLHSVDTEKISTRWLTTYNRRKPKDLPKHKPMWRPTYRWTLRLTR